MNLVPYGVQFIKQNLVYGVGGLDDLLVRLRQEELADAWYAEVHRGIYYTGTTWNYQYVEPQTITVQAPSGLVPVPVAIIPSGATLFPVQVSGSAGQYRYLPCAMALYETVSLSASGGWYRASVDGLVTELFLNGERLFRSVQLPQTPHDYCFRNGTVYLKASGTCVLSYLRALPSLWQHCMVHTTGGTQITVLAPPVPATLTVHTPTGMVASAVSATGTTVTLDNELMPGNYAARYLVDRSFCVVPTTGGALVYVYTSGADTLHVTYEMEHYRHWITASSENLHPLSTNRRSLFVAWMPQAPTVRKPAVVYLECTPPFFYTSTGEGPSSVQVLASVCDANGHPVSGATVTLSVPSEVNVYRVQNGVVSSGATGTTDAAGQAAFVLQPTSGFVADALSVSASAQLSSTTVTGRVNAPAVKRNSIPQSPSLDGGASIVLRDILYPQPQAEGWYLWVLSVTFLDGTPLPPGSITSVDIVAEGARCQQDGNVGEDGIVRVMVQPESSARISATVSCSSALGVLVTNRVEHRYEAGVWR